MVFGVLKLLSVRIGLNPERCPSLSVQLQGAIRSALAYGSCMIETDESKKFSCFLDKVSVVVVNAGCKFPRNPPGQSSVADGCVAEITKSSSSTIEEGSLCVE